jgi:alkaline phosphatase
MYYLLVLIFQLLLPRPVEVEARPKNIILLIGDGMGLTQISAALYVNGDTLNLAHFPVTGLVKTHSSRERITDSAAGATAMACGCKTRNGAIGVDEKGNTCVSIVELCEQAGLATGLVATSSLTHATPASFVAHVSSRSQAEDIATAFLATPVDLLIGGGLKHFTQRADGRNLVTDLQAKGYVIETFEAETFAAPQLDPAKPYAYFSALGEPVLVSHGRGDFLPRATRSALPFLRQRSDKGFFAMIEGSQIDWACHANKGQDVVTEMLDFDAAIGEALRFARADGQTLVIVTADHETGGMAIDMGSTRDSLNLAFTTKQHTAALVPVFAYGPGAGEFHGVQDNTDLFRKMRQLLGL